MFSYGINFIVSLYACFYLGIIPIPMHVLSEEVFDVEIEQIWRLVTSMSVNGVLKEGSFIDPKWKRFAQLKKVQFEILIFEKIAKSKGKLSIKDSMYFKPDKSPVLTQVYFNHGTDIFSAFQLTNENIMEQCRIFCIHRQNVKKGKTDSSPLIACIKAYNGFGFIYSSILGIYLGSSTICMLPETYLSQPYTYFQLIEKYKSNIL